MRPAVHLAIPVDDLTAARGFYGGVLELEEGRSSDHWIDWNLHGHQLVTHLGHSPAAPGLSEVDGSSVPIPHFGLLLEVDRFHALADRLRAADVEFLLEPHCRFQGLPAEQWTMFFLDPARNALEFKAFLDESQVFAR